MSQHYEIAFRKATLRACRGESYDDFKPQNHREELRVLGHWSVPDQLHNEEFRFCRWSKKHYNYCAHVDREIRHQHGAYAPLSYEDDLYGFYEPRFQEHLGNQEGDCGIVTGYGGLVAIVIHDPTCFCYIIKEFGMTFGLHNASKDSIATLFYHSTGKSIPNAMFYRRHKRHEFLDKPFTIESNPLHAVVLTDKYCVHMKEDRSRCEFKHEQIRDIDLEKLSFWLNWWAIEKPLSR